MPRVLIIVENLPIPFDRRVWSEATTLCAAGYEVSVICPKGPGAEKSFEIIDGIHVWRHSLPLEARGAAGYLLEYSSALFWEFILSIRVWVARGFDVIQACNPPDLIFLVAGFWKIFFGVRFIFDQHDIGPELYEAKFDRRDFFWKLLCWFERRSFALADVSIATNNSYREIAVGRGRMAPDKVFVVRSGPNLARVREVSPDARWKNGRASLVAYVGVIGAQEGLDLLLDSVAHIVRLRGRTDIQFVIIGAGPELETVRALANTRGLDAFVTFTGRVDDATLFAALSTADVCVNPDRPNAMNDKSTMKGFLPHTQILEAMRRAQIFLLPSRAEGFPNALVEAMALGLAPIVTPVGAIPEIIEGTGAPVIPAKNPRALADAIARLVSDPDLCARTGETSRETVRVRYTHSAVMPILRDAWSSVPAKK